MGIVRPQTSTHVAGNSNILSRPCGEISRKRVSGLKGGKDRGGRWNGAARGKCNQHHKPQSIGTEKVTLR